MPEFTTLIEVDHLYENHLNPDWIVIDCRFDLFNPDWGFLDYQQAHIPGSVYAHLDHDLSAQKTPYSGRHPLPDPQEFCRRMGNLGISNASQVVVLDSIGGAFCSRLWWMLRWVGHSAAALLNGGLAAWKSRAFPLIGGIEARPAKQFLGQVDMSRVATSSDVLSRLADPHYKIIDARAPARHRGEVEPIDSLAGRIPASLNRFHENNLQPDGRLKSAQVLREEFTQLLAGTSPENTIVYCGSGVIACHHLLAMEYADIHGAKLYAGSWSEWIRDPLHPVEKG